jgi:serine/threonine-protein kinase
MSIDEQELRTWLSSASAVNDQLPGELELMSVLASGGQGAVFRGSYNGHPAAVKVYFPGQLHKRIEREVRALEKIGCYSIAPLLWWGSLSREGYNLPVVATELVEGVPLDKTLAHGSLATDQLGAIAYDVAAAVEAMWKYRIVHRDLKPSNILIRENGRACVIDLGLARHVDESSLTVMGATWGTYGYLSPEQTKGVRGCVRRWVQG